MTNISLIITCYNSSLTIEIIIKQILEIIKDNDEIVIVDDGSTDNTTKIIKHIISVMTSIITIVFNLFSPQNLRTFDTSNSILSMLFMALWSMTPIMVAHATTTNPIIKPKKPTQQ